MASQSDNSVSEEFGELLQLLNALEAQDSRPLDNFATLERMLAAGKVASAEPSIEDVQSDAGVVEGPELHASDEERIAQPDPNWRDDEWSDAEIENRFAVHVVQGMRKSMKDWTP